MTTRFVMEVGGIQYAGDLDDNRKTSMVSHINDNFSLTLSNVHLQIDGFLYYILTFNDGDARIRINQLKAAYVTISII
jgi:hypothetical protein